MYELKEGGRDVEDYLSGGAAAELIDSRNEFVKSLEHVMAQLLPGTADAPVVRPVRTTHHRKRRRRK